MFGINNLLLPLLTMFGVGFIVFPDAIFAQPEQVGHIEPTELNNQSSDLSFHKVFADPVESNYPPPSVERTSVKFSVIRVPHSTIAHDEKLINDLLHRISNGKEALDPMGFELVDDFDFAIEIGFTVELGTQGAFNIPYPIKGRGSWKSAQYGTSLEIKSAAQGDTVKLDIDYSGQYIVQQDFRVAQNELATENPVSLEAVSKLRSLADPFFF